MTSLLASTIFNRLGATTVVSRPMFNFASLEMQKLPAQTSVASHLQTRSGMGIGSQTGVSRADSIMYIDVNSSNVALGVQWIFTYCNVGGQVGGMCLTKHLVMALLRCSLMIGRFCRSVWQRGPCCGR